MAHHGACLATTKRNCSKNAWKFLMAVDLTDRLLEIPSNICILGNMTLRQGLSIWKRQM